MSPWIQAMLYGSSHPNIMKGFTLIEMILYLALFSVLIFGLLNASFVILGNLDRHDQHVTALEEGNFIIAKIDWLLTSAQVVYEPVLNSTSTTLRLKNADSLYRIEASSTDVVYKKDFGVSSPLNAGGVVVNNFIVEHGQINNAPAWVRVSFTIKDIVFSIIRYTRL